MTVQANYDPTLTQAFAGQVADASTYDAISRRNTHSAALGYGIAVLQDTADDDGALLGGGGAFLGVTVRDVTQVGENYAQNAEMAVMYRGTMFVTVVEAVTAGAPVTYDANGALGDTGTAIPGAVWETTTAAAAIGKIRLT